MYIKENIFLGGAEKNLWRKKLNFSEKNYGNNGKILVGSSFICEAANHLNRTRRIFVLRGTKISKKSKAELITFQR